MTNQTLKILIKIDFDSRKIRECKIIEDSHVTLESSDVFEIESGEKLLGRCQECANNFQIFLYGETTNKVHGMYESVVVKMEEDNFLENKLFIETEEFPEVKSFDSTNANECRFCCKHFKNIQGLNTHEKFCKENPNRIKNKSEMKEVTMKTVTTKVEQESRECQYCSKTFKSNGAQAIHEKYCKISREKEKEPDTLIKCKSCDTEFPSVSSLRSHRPSCTGEVSNSKRPPQCSICQKSYSNWSLVRRHEQMIHERRINFTCEICGFGTYSQKSFDLHLIKAHSDNPKPFVCDLCPTRNKFGTRNSILYHMKLHHLNQAKYMCQMCPRKFITKTFLDNHISSVHSFNRPFPCPDCDKCFKHSGDVRVHRYKVHIPKEKKPRMLCNECDFITHDKHSFSRHKLLHLDESEKPFHCKFCNKGFPSQSNQLRHEKTHLDIRPFICTFCEKAFRTKEDLKVHVRYHTGEKPYECEICGQRYGDRGCYRSHLIGHEKQLGITLDKSVKKFINKPKLIDKL